MSTSDRLRILIAIWLLVGEPFPRGSLIDLPLARAQHPGDRSAWPARAATDEGRLRRLPPISMGQQLPLSQLPLSQLPLSQLPLSQLPLSQLASLRESSLVPLTNETGSTESLAGAWEIALNVDRALEAKRWYASSAQSSQRAAQAERYPRLKMEGSYTGRSDYQAFKFRSGDPSQPITIFPYEQNENAAFRCGMELPLLTSGAIGHGIEAARETVSATEMEAQRSAGDMKMRVAEEYVAVLGGQRDLEVTETTARSLASHAADVAKLFEHGQVPRNDLLAAQVALSNAEQDVIRARHHLDASRAAYNRRLGRPLTAAVKIAELPVSPTQGSLEELTSQALHRRREPSQMAAQISSLRHLAARHKAQNGLQVNLRGEYAFAENRFRTPEGISSLGVIGSWNVYDGGKNRYRATALQQRADGLASAKKDIESQIALEVRRAWLDVQETGQRRVVATEAIQRAEENIRAAKGRYKAGTAIGTEVLDAESLRAQAYRNRDHANYDAVLAALRVRHATGQL